MHLWKLQDNTKDFFLLIYSKGKLWHMFLSYLGTSLKLHSRSLLMFWGQWRPQSPRKPLVTHCTVMESDLKNTIPKFRHGGLNIKSWALFCAKDTGQNQLKELKVRVLKRQWRNLRDLETFCRVVVRKLGVQLQYTSHRCACQQGFLYQVLIYILLGDRILISLKKMHNIF